MIGVAAALSGLVFFVLGWALGQRHAIDTLAEMLRREGARPDSLPSCLARRLRPSTRG